MGVLCASRLQAAQLSVVVSEFNQFFQITPVPPVVREAGIIFARLTITSPPDPPSFLNEDFLFTVTGDVGNEPPFGDFLNAFGLCGGRGRTAFVITSWDTPGTKTITVSAFTCSGLRLVGRATLTFQVLPNRPPALKIGLGLDKSTVEPSPNRLNPNLVTARVTVTDTTGQGKPNVSVALNAKAVDLAVAGHDHAGNAPNVLHNLSSAPTGSFQDVVTRQPTQTCMTESDGTCQVFYTAELVSGRYRIIAALSTDSTVSDSKDLTVQLSGIGLVPLEPGSTYQLTGSWNGGSNGVTSQHTLNHFGTIPLIVRVSVLAALYFSKTGGILGINDMSLPAGGLFDINNDWTPPHNLHRKGSSVDIDRNHANDGRPVDRMRLDLLAEFWLTRIPEDSKIHYEAE